MRLLKLTLVLNATSCLLFGLLFLIFSSHVNAFIGNSLNWLTPTIGAVLVFHGCHLLLATKRQQPWCLEILYFVVGDFAWVIASFILIYLGIVITTPFGAYVAISVAAMVGCFGILQLIAYKRSCTSDSLAA